MTKSLFLIDSYLKQSKAKVVSIKDGKYLILNQTIFYPKGGGQPYDTGKILKDNEIYNVVYVGKFNGEISHEIDHPGLQPDDDIQCILNWERRYKLMKSHTAAHVLAAILNKGTGALITGNQLSEEKVRFDFNLHKFEKTVLQEYLKKANKLFGTDIAVRSYNLPREEALKIPGVIKMAAAFPPNLPILRIVEIEGLDKQADGGTHVKNLKEIGRIELIKTENKGKNNRRIYFKIN